MGNSKRRGLTLFSFIIKDDNWLVVSTPPKNISQLGLLFPIYGKTNVPNHQPDMELRPPHFSLLTLWKSMEFPDFHVEKRLPPSSAMALSPMFTRKCLNIFSYVWQPQFFSVGVTVMATAITGWDSKSFKPSRSWGELEPPPPRKEALAEGVTHIARQGVAQKIHPHLGTMASMAM